MRKPGIGISRCVVVAVGMFALQARGQTPEDTATEPALEPTAALATFNTESGLDWKGILAEPVITQPLQTTFDAQGRLWVVEYRQYPNPEGLEALSRDRHWRIVYDRTPLPPGKGGVPGKDRVSVHEDRDRDGQFETHHVFVEGLNIASACAPDAHGAWVLNPPYLLYYRDDDHDLRADGDPEIHLSGFGLEDTHSVVNSLCFGPDGWLYAAQGSTVSGNVKRYGSEDRPYPSMGQAIWRYHPRTHRYEIFAEGGGNAFGVAFNDEGELFSGHNGGDTRGFHYYQGGYYRKGFSKHGDLSNPNSYGYLNPMKHDPIPRFTHTMLLTESTSLAQPSHRTMLAVDPLHGKLIHTALDSIGSTYETKDLGDTVTSSDKWFRPVAISDGPDGAAYVCDWYDSVVAHIYAFEGRLDRDRGRVYRLGPATENPKVPSWDSSLANGTDVASINYLLSAIEHPYRWQRWQAVRCFAHHPMRESMRDTVVRKISESVDTKRALDWLWLAHACGWIRDTIPFGLATDTKADGPALTASNMMTHPDPMVRGWAIRLLCDDESIEPRNLDVIVEHLVNEPNVKVLCMAACSAKRLPVEESVRMLAAILQNQTGAEDPFLPLLCWWAAEHHAASVPVLRERLVSDARNWQHPLARRVVFPNLVRRWSVSGTREAFAGVAEIFGRIGQLPDTSRGETAALAQEAFEQAFVGRSLSGVPDSVIDAMVALGQPSLTLAVRRGNRNANSEASERIRDRAASERLRLQLMHLAGELASMRDEPKVLEALLYVSGQVEEKRNLRAAAYSAMGSYEDPRIPETLLEGWPSLAPELRPAVGSVLAARQDWTRRWVDACEQGRVSADELPPESVRAMRMHDDLELQSRLGKLYPAYAAIDLNAANQRAQELASKVLEGSGDPYRGKKLYRELCGRCHRLFDEGGAVGPELTGYQRDQLVTLLRNIVAPSLEIREGYQMVRVLADDGLVLTGFVENQSDDQIALRNIDGQLHTLDRSGVESMQAQVLSLMPEGLLERLDEAQLRDLMAYLRSSQPLNDGS